MIEAPLAFAFSVGLVATVNPCGFAMLPAYLSYFLGLEGAEADDARASLGRALATGALVTAGFMAVFSVVGLIVSLGVDGIRDALPWVTIAIGVALTVLGIAMLAGLELSVALPRLQRGGSDRTARSILLFGMSYATASLSCAFPLFLTVMTVPEGFVSSVASFVAFASGMALVLLALTVSLALARSSVVNHLRAAMRYVNPVSGALLIVAGLYTIWYWLDAELTDAGNTPGPIRWVEERSADLTQWVSDTGGLRVGLVLAILVALAGIYVLARPSGGRTQGHR